MKSDSVKIGRIGITKRGRKRIYWMETKAGHKGQKHFRWGALKSKKLDQIVNLYNAAWGGSLRARKALERRYHAPSGSFQSRDTFFDNEIKTKIDPLKDSDHVFCLVLAEIKKMHGALKAELQHKISIGRGNIRRERLRARPVRLPFSDFVCKAVSLNAQLRKLEKEDAPKLWSPEKLDEFLETVAPIREAIGRIEKIRQVKVNR